MSTVLTRPAARQERLFGEAGLVRPPAPPPSESGGGIAAPPPRTPASERAGGIAAPPPRTPATERAGGIAAPPPRPRAPHEPPAPEPAAPATACSTLDQAISGLWDELLAGEPAPCPVCGSAMQPRESAGVGVLGGSCPSCGSTLA
jgi:hypothetical protein